jgi:phosphoribosylformylglycinamidine synthase
VARLDPGTDILLVEPSGSGPSLAGSKWAKEVHGHSGGILPDIDYAAHRRLLELVAEVAAEGAVGGMHDVSDGGLALAVAEMAVAGRTGFRITVPAAIPIFAEGPSRVLLSADPAQLEILTRRATEAGLTATRLGRAGGDRLIIEGRLNVGLDDAAAAWSGALPEALAIH